jgi:hypothetical protein
MMDDLAAGRHSRPPDGGPVDAGKSVPVAAKAAAIDAAQARPLTWKNVVKRALAVAAADAAIYLVLPGISAVLGAWPRLSTLNPIWFTVALAAELVSFTCNFALQRLALAGVRPGPAFLATLAYRIASYWLPLLAGPPAYLLFRHRYGTPVPPPADHHETGADPEHRPRADGTTA